MVTDRELNVVALAYNGLSTFELGIAIEVFGANQPELDRWYQFRVCAVEPGPLRAAGGIRVEVSASSRALSRAGTIIVPGWRAPQDRPPEIMLNKLRQAHERGARIVSVCSGAFVLAAAGLLDGRRATTHWRHAGMLRELYPQVMVDADVLYVDEGSILTSAGSSAGIDVCLHLVRRDFGSEIANRVARGLVMPPHRDGGQAQYVETPVPGDGANHLARLLDWLRRHLDQPLTVESIARKAHMSPRTLARRFSDSVGETPHRWLSRERVQLAQRLLETTDHSVEQISRLCGMRSGQLLRLHFRRLTGTTPTAYRRMFRHVGPPGVP